MADINAVREQNMKMLRDAMAKSGIKDIKDPRLAEIVERKKEELYAQNPQAKQMQDELGQELQTKYGYHPPVPTVPTVPVDPIADQGIKEEEQARTTQAEQNQLLQDWIDKLSTKTTDEQAGRQKQFAELINKQKTTGDQYLTDFRSGRSKRLSDMANLLSQTAERNMSEATPSILEDLSSRGLLHSSAVGDELAKRKKQLAAATSESLQAQNLADLDAEQELSNSNLSNIQTLEKAGLSSDIDLSQWGLGQEAGLGTTGYQNNFDMAKQILQNKIDMQRAGIERKFSVEDLDKEMALARELAQKQADSANSQSKTNLWGQLGGIGLDFGLNKLWGGK